MADVQLWLHEVEKRFNELAQVPVWPRPCTYVTVTSAALLTPDNRHSICPEDKVWGEKQLHDFPKGLGETCQVPGSFHCSSDDNFMW